MSMRPLAWAGPALLLATGVALAQPAADPSLDAALKSLNKSGGAAAPGTTPAPAASPGLDAALKSLTKTSPPTAQGPAVQTKAPAAEPKSASALPKAATPAAQTKAAITPVAQPKAATPAATAPVAAAPAPATPAPAARPPASEPVQTAARDEAAPEDDLPRGAPADDYQFIAWCDGVLATHMQLYTRVKPELDAISIRWNTVAEDAKDYSDQQIAGREALSLFERALATAEAASTRNLIPERRYATQVGISRWDELRTVDARNQAYSWLLWELPERCSRVAHQLEDRSRMLAALLRNNATVAVAPPSPATPAPAIPAPAASAPKN